MFPTRQQFVRDLGAAFRRRVREHKPDPLTSLVFTIPLFLLYHLGILFMTERNGVDLVSELMLRLLTASVPGYVVFTFAVALALASSVWLLRRFGTLQPRALMPVLSESLLWAILLAASVGLFAEELAPTLASLQQARNVFEKMVVAAGAGFHEEIVFRVVLLSGGALLLQKAFKLGSFSAYSISLAASAFAFAGVHHVGSFGEPFTVLVFASRVFMGLYFAAIYLLRGLAMVVYTHAIYDALFFVLSA